MHVSAQDGVQEKDIHMTGSWKLTTVFTITSSASSMEPQICIMIIIKMNRLIYETAGPVGQKLVLTDLGYIGVCPGSALDGDLVTLPPHFEDPVVLRNCSGPANKRDAEHHKLAGTAPFPSW